MEVIPQKQYLIDNVVANKCGEWPGIKPCKWTGSIRVLRPATQGNIFDNNTTLPFYGRRHFSAKHSNEMNFKPAKKLFMETKNLTNIEDKKQGLKAVNPKFTENKIYYQKRLFPPRYGTEVDPEIFHIRTFYPDGNTRTHKEMSLEKTIGGKKRLPHLDLMRNGMVVRAPGDKCYQNPEYSKDFFKDGGLIPGSSSNPNYNKTASKRSDNFYQTIDLNVKTLNPDKIWNNKVKKEESEFDNTYVKTLTNWDNTVLKEYSLPEPIKGKGQIPANNSQRGKVSISKTDQKSAISKNDQKSATNKSDQKSGNSRK